MRSVRSVVAAGCLVAAVATSGVAAFGAAPAGALTRPTAGTEDLCPATKPLTESDHKHEASVIRAYLGCRVSDDPGPNNPGGKN